MGNIRELSISEIDIALCEARELRRSSLREGASPDTIMAIEKAVTRLTNELRRRGL
ncbi:hypothetical protein [Rhodococcus sovatensis]|uniref:Uncharacterized protein n=1 Tax=Rhodococcus sovatensis TaxID=1805840 RepID=A0ABZ2PSK8_9NOCA